ncbi:hypothetical protein ACSBR1_022389 [Camellia fascicularis]
MQKGLSNIIIETDSQIAMEMLRAGAFTTSPYLAIIEDAKFLLSRCQCTIQHTPREGNYSVDALTNIGVNQQEHLVFLENPPSSLLSFLVTDMVNAQSVKD